MLIGKLKLLANESSSLAPAADAQRFIMVEISCSRFSESKEDFREQEIKFVFSTFRKSSVPIYPFPPSTSIDLFKSEPRKVLY